jgi:hypothetical protein
VQERGGGNIPVIEMKLRETATAVYDWNSGEETTVDPAPNTNLPDVFNVDAVSGLRFDSFAVETLAGDFFYRIVLSYDEHPDTFVVQGGQYEVQFKLSAESEWRPSFFVDGEVNSTEVTAASAGTEYDIRIRAVNNIGVRGPWSYFYNVVTGTGGGVTESDDWGNFTDSGALSQDWGNFTDSGLSDSEDWGGLA